MKTNRFFPWTAIAVAFSMACTPVTTVLAAKPIQADAGVVLLEGSVSADDGSGLAKDTFDVEVKSGKETVITIVVRQFWFEAGFAQLLDFFDNEYGDMDGATCFGDPVMVSGAYRLFDDGTAEFTTYPEFLTADGKEIQKYFFLLTGVHYLESLQDDFPLSGGAPITLDFDRVEIATEGKGQNRRRSCTGVFDGSDGFGATATFSRPPG